MARIARPGRAIDADALRAAGLHRAAIGSIAAVASGGLLSLSFAPASLYPLTFVALAPLASASRNRRLRVALCLGWLSGVVFHLTSMHWALPTIARFEQTSLDWALPAFAVFVTYHALQFAFFAGVASLTRSPAMIASAWVLIEWVFPRILPWTIGAPLVESSRLAQIAELCGAYGLSAAVITVNASIANAFILPDIVLSRRLRAIAPAVLIPTALYLYGGVGAPAAAEPATDQLRVTIVQGNIHSGRRDVEAANAEAWDIYSNLTLNAAAHSGAALVVWPESVLRLYLRDDVTANQLAAALALRIGRPLLVGSLELAPDSREWNNAYLFPPDAAAARQIYRKTTLFPFGEYVPGSNVLPFLRSWRTTGAFVPGEAGRLLTIARYRHIATDKAATMLAPSICFEAIHPGRFNAAVREGAELLINLTDDGWFGESFAPAQHLQLARLRAIETHRWMVRASNSGVSAFIDPRGAVTAQLGVGERGVLTHSVQLLQAMTPYVRFGDWPLAGAGLILTFGAVRRLKRRDPRGARR